MVTIFQQNDFPSRRAFIAQYNKLLFANLALGVVQDFKKTSHDKHRYAPSLSPAPSLAFLRRPCRGVPPPAAQPSRGARVLPAGGSPAARRVPPQAAGGQHGALPAGGRLYNQGKGHFPSSPRPSCAAAPT